MLFNFPENINLIVIISWFIMTMFFASIGFFDSRKYFYDVLGYKGLGIVGMIMNGVVMLSSLWLFFLL